MVTDIIIISGKINSGKTTRLREWVRSRTPEVNGVLSVPVWRNGKKRAYYAVDAASGEGMLLATETAVTPSFRHGRFFFPLTGFQYAETVLLKAVKKGTDTIVIDEIGPLELKGEGFAPVLHRLLQEFHGSLVLSLREYCLGPVADRFGIKNYSENLP